MAEATEVIIRRPSAKSSNLAFSSMSSVPTKRRFQSHSVIATLTCLLEGRVGDSNTPLGQPDCILK
jgi:hypothetical protein